MFSLLVDDAHWGDLRCLSDSLSIVYEVHVVLRILCSQFYNLPQYHFSQPPHLFPSTPLIPPSPINLIDQLPPTPHPPHILPQHLKRAVSIHIRTPAHMRRDQHIRCRPQRVISRQRLWVRDIESRATYEAVFKRLDKRGLVDDLAACDVRDECAAGVGLVEQVEFVGGEEVGCCFAAAS
jgi:hypothetical protein